MIEDDEPEGELRVLWTVELDGGLLPSTELPVDLLAQPESSLTGVAPPALMRGMPRKKKKKMEEEEAEIAAGLILHSTQIIIISHS